MMYWFSLNYAAVTGNLQISAAYNNTSLFFTIRVGCGLVVTLPYVVFILETNQKKEPLFGTCSSCAHSSLAKASHMAKSDTYVLMCCTYK